MITTMTNLALIHNVLHPIYSTYHYLILFTVNLCNLWKFAASSVVDPMAVDFRLRIHVRVFKVYIMVLATA